jgi:F-type H+-transporting ATPase subunit b
MQATLNALYEILLKAIPTFLLVLLLHFYLKKIFFGPLEKVRRQRFDATEGARRQAQAALEEAGTKTREYEAALREARAEIYREQEEARKRLRQDQDAKLAQARVEAAATVAVTRQALVVEADEAGRALRAESGQLAALIAQSVLNPRRSGI